MNNWQTRLFSVITLSVLLAACGGGGGSTSSGGGSTGGTGGGTGGTTSPPVLTVNSPLDGVNVFTTMTLSGSASSAASGTLTTTATFNGGTVLNSVSPTFSTAVPLSGATPGPYTVSVRSADSAGLTTTVNRSVTVVPAASLTQVTQGQVLAVDPTSSSTYVYAISNGASVTGRLRSASGDVLLQGFTQSDASNVFVYAGNVYSTIYRWDASGQRTTISGGAPAIVAVHDNFLLWRTGNGMQSYSLPNGPIAPVTADFSSTTNVNDADFYVNSGQLTVFYQGQVSAAPVAYDLFRWVQASNVTTRLTSNGNVLLAPRTDATTATVVWGERADSSSSCPATTAASCILKGQPIAGGAVQTYTSSLTGSAIANGLIAWSEISGSTTTVKVFNGTTTSTVVSRAGSVLYGTGNGYVLYFDNGSLFVWNTGGTVRGVLNSQPSNGRIADKTIYLTDSTGVIFQTTLP